jgi:SAM-dependent methyltransferase
MRLGQIEQILDRLEDYRSLHASDALALDHMKEFFLAARSAREYVRWSLWKSWRIPADELKEVLDFPELGFNFGVHRALAQLERKAFPGLVTPLVEHLARSIESEVPRRPGSIVLDLGAGGGEVIRQLLTALRQRGHERFPNVVAVDDDPEAARVARENLESFCRSLGIEFRLLERGREQECIERLGGDRSTAGSVSYVQGDAVEFVGRWAASGQRRVRIAYHVFLRHHLPRAAYERLNQSLRIAAAHIVEYDTLRSVVVRAGSTLENWDNPLLLQCAVFSALRGSRRRELAQHAGGLAGSVRTHRGAWYLLAWRGLGA